MDISSYISWARHNLRSTVPTKLDFLLLLCSLYSGQCLYFRKFSESLSRNTKIMRFISCSSIHHQISFITPNYNIVIRTTNTYKVKIISRLTLTSKFQYLVNLFVTSQANVCVVIKTKVKDTSRSISVN